MPVGNGRLAAMIFGGVETERLQINEGTVWAGEKRDRNQYPRTRPRFLKIRKLLFAGDPKQAEAIADKDVIAIPRRMPPYQTLGDLTLSFPKVDFQNNRRELDLSTAIVRITYRADGANYTREVFSSAPGQVVILPRRCDRCATERSGYGHRPGRRSPAGRAMVSLRRSKKSRQVMFSASSCVGASIIR